MQKIYLATLLVLISVSNVAFATTATTSQCKVDAAEMKAQIQQFSSIVTTDGKYITEVSRAALDNDSCVATGFWNRNYQCDMSWKQKDWGNTLTCDN